MFEFFTVPPAEIVHEIDRCVRRWSMQIGAHSHDHAVRRAQDGEPTYTNEDMEEILKVALSLRCMQVSDRPARLRPLCRARGAHVLVLFV
ncbi:MAG: hypothetical protein WA446_05795 [Steroidobacteraceae bacterium]